MVSTEQYDNNSGRLNGTHAVAVTLVFCKSGKSTGLSGIIWKVLSFLPGNPSSCRAISVQRISVHNVLIIKNATLSPNVQLPLYSI